ncbi:MAG: type II secretion system F family protein [Raoultibacter sp.]
MKIALTLFISIGIGLAAYLALVTRFMPHAQPATPPPAQTVPRKRTTNLSQITERINRFLPQTRASKDSLRMRLARAGIFCTPSTFYGVSVIAIAIGFAADMALVSCLPTKALPLNIALATTIGALALCAPRLYLNNKTRSRCRAIEAQLPATLELLAISVEAGLTIERAINHVATQGKGVLSDEFFLVNRDIELFGYSREQALERLAARCQIEGLSLFVAAIISSSKAGSPIAGVLKSQARSARCRRFQEIEEDANKIPTKMIFPLTFLIMPGVFIVVLTPAALSIAHNVMGVI